METSEKIIIGIVTGIAIIIVSILIFAGVTSIINAPKWQKEKMNECRQKTTDIDYCYKIIYGLK